MDDEAVADSNVASDSKVSTAKYKEIVRTVHNQDIKLKAMRNLHQIIQAKDQELKASCEKTQNLQAALDKAEMRLANQIRLTVCGAHQPTLNSDSVEQNANLVSGQFVGKRVSRTVSPTRPAANTTESSTTSSSDLEEDCAGEAVFQSTRAIAGNHLKLVSPPSLKEHIQKSKTTRSSVSTCSGDSVTLQSRGVGMSPPSVESVVKTEPISALDSMEKVSLSGSQSFKSIRSTGVSRDLLDKLMQQNARLKKVIREILQQKGASFEDYLDRQESQDVIEQLRDGLRLSKAQNEKLKDIINCRDSEDISKKYSELCEDFQKLKRTAAMMKAMADSYSKEYEKLKVENKNLKEELTTVNQKRKSLEQRQQKEPSSGTATSPISAGAESSISTRLYETTKLQYDEISMKLRDAEAEIGTLRLRCQQQSCYQQEADEMRRLCESLCNEKELLKTQVSVFQEDFAVEEKKHADKQQQLESSIAKHQDWIRKLVAEAQKCRSLFEEEKGKRERAETAKDELEKRFQRFIMQSRSVSSCAFEENRQSRISHRVLDDLQVDNGGESAPSNDRRENQPPGGASEHVQSDPLVCPRCEREFEAREEQKWKDHCARCTDD